MSAEDIETHTSHLFNGRRVPLDAGPHQPVNAQVSGAEPLLEMLSRRRSIKRLRHGSVAREVLERIAAAAHLTPAAFNQPTWHLVLVHERRAEFWDVIEAAFRAHLSGERLERYLDRLVGFRGSVAIAAVYEDIDARAAMEAAWAISTEQARAFSEQALGMVQLALWLAATEEGLCTSLQHWEWMVETRLAEAFGVDPLHHRLISIMPIGYPGEVPAPSNRHPLEAVVSWEQLRSSGR